MQVYTVFRYYTTLFSIICIAFFASWGEGMQNVFSKSSLVFPIFTVLLLAVNINLFLIKQNRIQLFVLPKEFKFLVLFILCHTFVFLLINPSFFTWGRSVKDSYVQDFEFATANSGEIIVRYFLYMTLSILLSYLFRRKNIFDLFSFFFCLGFILTILLGGYKGDYSGIVRFSGGMSDPNSMAFDAILAFFLSLNMWNKFRMNLLKVLLTIIISISAFSVLLSFSRGGILALVVGMLFFLYKKQFFSVKRVFITISVFLFLGLTLYATLPDEIKDVVGMRFSLEELAEKKGAGRVDIWKDYSSAISSYIFVGRGVANGTSALKSIGSLEARETHNQYLLYIVEFGIIGFLLYLLYLRKVLFLTLRMNSNYILLSSIVLSMLIVTLFLNVDKGRTFWIVIAIANYLYYLNYNKNINVQ